MHASLLFAALLVLAKAIRGYHFVCAACACVTTINGSYTASCGAFYKFLPSASVIAIHFRVNISAAERADVLEVFPRATVSDALDTAAPAVTEDQISPDDSHSVLKILLIITLVLFGIAILLIVYLLIWVRMRDPYLQFAEILPCHNNPNLR